MLAVYNTLWYLEWFVLSISPYPAVISLACFLASMRRSMENLSIITCNVGSSHCWASFCWLSSWKLNYCWNILLYSIIIMAHIGKRLPWWHLQRCRSIKSPMIYYQQNFASYCLLSSFGILLLGFSKRVLFLHWLFQVSTSHLYWWLDKRKKSWTGYCVAGTVLIIILAFTTDPQ